MYRFLEWKVIYNEERNFGSLYVSWKLPTYPSPKPTLMLTSHLGKNNVDLGEGQVGSFPETQKLLLPIPLDPEQQYTYFHH